MRLERLYVASGLGLRERAKGEGFAGDPEIRNHPIHELQKQSAPRTSFVELASRMEIARTIGGCRGHMVMGDECFSQRANGLFHLGGWCRIGQDGDIGAESTLSLKLCRGLCRGRGGLFRQVPGGLDGFEYAGGVVFAFLDVRLIEWVNPQEVACYGRGDFPP